MNRAVLVVVIVVVAGCGSNSPGTADAPGRADAAIDAVPDAGPISVSVSPPTAIVAVTMTQAFSAQVSNSSAGVSWFVNGVAGGNATVGTIASDGTYTAPVLRPHPITVTITAKSAADSSKSGTAMATVTASGTVYVTGINGSVAIFDAVGARNGNVAPTRTLAGITTTLTYVIGAAIDEANDRLLFCNYNNASGSVASFSGVTTATGNIAPVANLIGANTTLTTSESAQLDPVRHLLYVSSQQKSISVFDTSQPIDGNIAPLHVFDDLSESTGSSDRRIFLDVAADRLYLSDTGNGKVFIFDNASTTTGDVTATRVLGGTTTLIQCPWGVTVDTQRDLLYLSDYCTNNIHVFANASTVTGDVAPLQTFNSTIVDYPEDLSVDADTDRLAVQTQPNGGLNGIYFYDAASTLTGAQTAPTSVSGNLTTISSTQGMFMEWDR